MISVVTIFLNAEKFIEEAIESVLAQTFTDWELLLVDDGSNDASTTIAREYAEREPKRVLYIEHADHQQRGTGASSNRGILEARGEYITFLDADDVWVPHALAEQVALFEKYPEAAMVYGPFKYWYSWTGETKDQARDAVVPLGVPPDTLIQPPALLTLFLQRRALVPSKFMVRREIAKRVGAFEESFRDLYEDQTFCAKVCLAAPVFASSHCWFLYRQHADSICAVAETTGRYYTARGEYLNWLEAYLSLQGIKDKALWGALRQEQRWYRGRGVVRLFRHYPKLFRLLRLIEDRVHRVERRFMPIEQAVVR